MQPVTKKSGRIPMASIIAIHLLNGMDISKRETGGYELFRIYYHHASNNDFNKVERAKRFANEH